MLDFVLYELLLFLNILEFKFDGLKQLFATREHGWIVLNVRAICDVKCSSITFIKVVYNHFR